MTTQPEIKKRKGISLVWLLPLVAAFIATWLMYKSISEAGVPISITFNTAKGIEAGKTKIIYKGIQIGIVNRVEVGTIQKIIIHAEITPEMKPWLSKKTQFWLVKPQLSLSGISGLETLVSGRYIAIAPVKGKLHKHFVALSFPPLDIQKKGLRLQLVTKKLGSISQGSKIYYQQMAVGEVQRYYFNTQHEEIIIDIFIEEKFAHLVKNASRFWNTSGIKINANLTEGVQISTQSLSSIIMGGISFYTPTGTENIPVKTNQRFILYSDFDDASAKDGIIVKIHFADSKGIEAGKTLIKKDSITLGKVLEVHYLDDNFQAAEVIALFNYKAKKLLQSDTQFWLIKPSLSLSKISAIKAIFKGSHIAILPGKQHSKHVTTSYTALAMPPLYYDTQKYVYLRLRNKHTISVRDSAPIYYKKIKIGEVLRNYFSSDKQQVVTDIIIEKSYQDILHHNSRFYYNGGIQVNADAKGIQLQTETLLSVLSGGIHLLNPSNEKGIMLKPDQINQQDFILYPDQKSASDQGRLLFQPLKGLYLKLYSSENTSISKNAPIYFKKMPVGKVLDTYLLPSGKKILIHTLIYPQYMHLINSSSRFWNSSGIRISSKLPNITIQSESLLSLLAGGISFNTPRTEKEVLSGTSFTLLPDYQSIKKLFPAIKTKHYDLRLQTKNLGSIDIGSQLYYQKIPIGQVEDYQLEKDGNILLYLSIKKPYQYLIKKESRFYHSSGIRFFANLPTKIQIEMESINSLLAGGINLDNPPNSTYHNADKSLLFTLFDTQEDANKENNLMISIIFDSGNGINTGTAIKYQGIEIGQVEQIRFTPNNQVKVYINIASFARHLIRENSIFWLVEPTLGLAKTENLDTLVSGKYITLKPGQGEEKTYFTGYLTKPLYLRKQEGLNISLLAKNLGSIKRGDPILYKRIPVGTVSGYELNNTADKIRIYINIKEKYRNLVRDNSKFWHASGISMNFSIFSGLKIDTQSLESIVAGGIAFATPEEQEQEPDDNNNESSDNNIEDDGGITAYPYQYLAPVAKEGTLFTLYTEPQKEWLQWAPEIPLQTTQNSQLIHSL